MRHALGLMILSLALSACMTTRRAPVTGPTAAWDQRLETLQHANTWQLEGRAAVAMGTQGWQASLDWHQSGAESEVHLAGPFGAGATALKRTAAGLSLNGGPPGSADMSQLQDRLGFELPLDQLRYWLLGVPDPGSSFELARNDQDRAQQLTQGGWTVVYDQYKPVGGDVLPARVVLSRDNVRVKIAIEHWEAPR